MSERYEVELGKLGYYEVRCKETDDNCGGHDERWIAEEMSSAMNIAHERSGADELRAALKALEPYLDAIVCYASTMEEHEPNRLVVQARAALAKYGEEK